MLYIRRSIRIVPPAASNRMLEISKRAESAFPRMKPPVAVYRKGETSYQICSKSILIPPFFDFGNATETEDYADS